MDEWISCYNKLPEMYDYFNCRRSCDVLVYADYDEYYIGCFDQYNNGTTFFQPKNGDGWQVHHEIFWCDLPSPPNKKTEV